MGVPSAQAFVRRCERTWRVTHANLMKSAAQMKQLADRRRTPAPTYQVGQRVWTLHQRHFDTEGTRKLAPCFVIKVISPTAVRLRLPPTMRRVHPTFHVSRLKPVVTHALFPTPVPPPPPASLMGGGLLRSTGSWTAGAVDCSTWWTERATTLRFILDKDQIRDFNRDHPVPPLRRQEAPPRGGGGWWYCNDLYSVCICFCLF